MAPQPVKFVILFQGRTGSTFLVDALRRHPEVDADGEILQNEAQELRGWKTHENPYRRAWRTGKLAYRGTPVESQLRRTEQRWRDARPGAMAVGFKTKIRDLLDIESFKDLLEREGARVIMMERDNLVKQAVSRVRSMDLWRNTKASSGHGDWNLMSEKDRLGESEIPFAEFDRMLQLVTYDKAVLQASVDYLDVPKIRMEYADLLRDRDAWLGRVFDFLGVRHVDLESGVLKNTSDDLSESVSNFAELRARYVGTPYEEMFDEKVVAATA
jgi:LPS sulfotransferase NodH